ncbi:YraN family protein [Bartonella sp. W8122]|uniref:YraN family protein n=1 Tax=Bartonella sp. W8122 TaxID=2750930 RepID=UPI0018DCB666|nr:YraN family protein [Bartonella sp. W8122]MBI0002153.1 YraN family protein [Bartonella sp. W8122]
MNKKRKQKTYLRGIYAERLAGLWLQMKGYHIAARRFETGFGEIDIIARRGHVIAIVEVKARPNLEEAMEAVKQQSRKRIDKAANVFLARQPDAKKLRLRYDLIAISPWKLPRHIEGFFHPENF